jgi:hypothetical protein
VPGLLGADLIGVAVFAAQGASAAVAKRLDLFGAAFGGFVAALGGGILRDLVIGGGVARDLLAGEIPVVLQRDIYAVVALGGTAAGRDPVPAGHGDAASDGHRGGPDYPPGPVSPLVGTAGGAVGPVLSVAAAMLGPASEPAAEAFSCPRGRDELEPAAA